MKKIYSILALTAMILLISFGCTKVNAYADEIQLRNTAISNPGQYKIPSKIWWDDSQSYCRVDPQRVSTSLTSRDLPNGAKIGSLAPREEAVRLAVANGNNGEVWWLIKYWVGAPNSGKTKAGWVNSDYIFY